MLNRCSRFCLEPKLLWSWEFLLISPCESFLIVLRNFWWIFQPLFLQAPQSLSFISLAIISPGSWDFILCFSGRGLALCSTCSVPLLFQEIHLDPCWDLFQFQAIFPTEQRRIPLSSCNIFRCFLLQFNIHWSPEDFSMVPARASSDGTSGLLPKHWKKSLFSMKNHLTQLSHPTAPPKNKLEDKTTLNKVGFFNNSLFEFNYGGDFCDGSWISDLISCH